LILYDEPSIQAQIAMFDLYDFGVNIREIMNANNSLWSDDPSENGLFQDYNETTQQLIATIQAGSTTIVKNTQQPGDYLNVRLCFKTLSGDLACTGPFEVIICLNEA
jgi:hypothetical protein